MDGCPPLRIVDEKSILLRLRCAKLNTTAHPDEHVWASTDTSWIPYSYFTLNGKNLEQRQKLHYGKDLPIDLTHLVKQGDNTLEIAILRQSTEKHHHQTHRLAIEILGIQTHTTLMQNILTNNRLPASTTKQTIINKLKPASLDDDDLLLLNTTLTISITDAFSSKMCATPVRSRACDHFECFDLATFLATRKRNGDATLADHWKCPVCAGDARPQHLVVDEFMQGVYDELRRQGAEDTRAITVGEDGEWKVKGEVLEGVADADADVDHEVDREAEGGRGALEKGERERERDKESGSREVEIIELEDSD